MNALRHFIGAKDLVCALIKGMIYGAVIPIISCAYGFRCKGGRGRRRNGDDEFRRDVHDCDHYSGFRADLYFYLDSLSDCDDS